MNDQPLIVPYRESGKLYMLVQDYKIDLTPYGYNLILTIPQGFVYDGASVPRFLWSIVGLGIDGLHRAAALVHDYLYENQGRISGIGAYGFAFTRKQSDVLFRDMMRRDKIANHRVWLAYKGVRLFGKKVWNN